MCAIWIGMSGAAANSESRMIRACFGRNWPRVRAWTTTAIRLAFAAWKNRRTFARCSGFSRSTPALAKWVLIPFT
jgi:hypothetical protein